MTVSHYHQTEHSDVTYVQGGDINELFEAVAVYAARSSTSWRVEGESIVLSEPMGSELVGRSVDK